MERLTDLQGQLMLKIISLFFVATFVANNIPIDEAT